VVIYLPHNGHDELPPERLVSISPVGPDDLYGHTYRPAAPAERPPLFSTDQRPLMDGEQGEA
jgi:hypothetical protein